MDTCIYRYNITKINSIMKHHYLTIRSSQYITSTTSTTNIIYLEIFEKKYKT